VIISVFPFERFVGCKHTSLVVLWSRLVSASAVFRTVEIAIPTILIDEADTFLDTNEGLRGILNSGHRRGGVVGDNHEPRQFSTHSPAAIAMIGKLPPTLADRSIAVTLRRRLPDEAVKPFHSHKTDNLKQLARKSARWVKDNIEYLQEIDPELPPDLANRASRQLAALVCDCRGRWRRVAKSDQTRR
jgi:putative DNA primase/helicase